MSFAPSDPSGVQAPPQWETDQRLVRTDLNDVDPELREEVAQRQREACERLYGHIRERRTQHVDTSDLPRSMTAEERHASTAFHERLKALSKRNPAPGLHLTFPQFLGAIEDDPEGFKAWSRTHRLLNLRPDPNDLT